MKHRTGLFFNVGEILKPSAGVGKEFDIKVNLPDIDGEIKTTAPVTGTIRFLASDEGVVGLFKVETALEMACSVDGELFRESVRLQFDRQFHHHPEDDSIIPILSDNSVDLLPALREEIIINVPLRPLCPKHKDSTSSS